jgi:polygalacturonase
MLEFMNCRRLKIQDVRIENAPGWTLRIVNCDNVDIHGIAIKNPVNGPNTDGIDITGCQNVTVANSSVDTGDDAICLKSENPYGPEPRLLKNILVTNCRLTTCCNGFKLGTSSEGGFESITFSDSVVYNADVPFRERVISGLAL